MIKKMPKKGNLISSKNVQEAEQKLKLKIPKEIKKGLKLNRKDVSILNIVRYWFGVKGPTIYKRQTCRDVLSDLTDDDRQFMKEMQLGSKLAMIAYAFPYFISRISLNFHLKNLSFDEKMTKHIANSSFLAFKHLAILLALMFIV